MNIYSWNVNGIRSALKKGLENWFHETNPDIEANLFKTAQNVNLDRVIAYKKNMVRHSFLDEYGSS